MKKFDKIIACIEEIYAGRIYAYFDHNNVRYTITAMASEFVNADRFRLKPGYMFELKKKPFKIYKDDTPIFIQNRHWWDSIAKVNEIWKYLHGKQQHNIK